MTLQLALNFGFLPVVPPRLQRLEPWLYDRATPRRGNEIERLFHRLKGFRCIFSALRQIRQTGCGFSCFLYFALIVEALRHLFSVNTP
jgi:hypothetical protein